MVALRSIKTHRISAYCIEHEHHLLWCDGGPMRFDTPLEAEIMIDFLNLNPEWL
jgi:hypothetical protein